MHSAYIWKRLSLRVQEEVRKGNCFEDPLPDDSSADSVKVSDLVGGVH